MCTVTLIPLADGWSLTTNRDESRRRPTAIAPTARPLPGGATGLYPTDPQGGGTWVAVNSVGLAMTLLNRNACAGVEGMSTGSLSRGLIIPALLPADGIARALDRLNKLDLRHYGSFRLLLVDGSRAAIATSDSSQARATIIELALGPLMLTSSSLGDDLVALPRQRLFADLVVNDWASVNDRLRLHRQAAFHQHHWPEASHLSVRMNRRDARTVSRTTVRVGPNHIRMAYSPVDETTGEGDLTELSLPRG